MRFARRGAACAEKPVVVVDNTTYDLSPLTAEIDGSFLETDVRASVSEAIDAGSLPVADPKGERFGAPITRPSAIYCVGMDYAAHAAESGSAPPENLVMFMKAPKTIAGPNDEVAIPRNSTKTDWEVELAIVVGRRASYLDGPERSIDRIAGFTITNDLSEREWQLEISGGGARENLARASRRSARGSSRPTRLTSRICGCTAASMARRGKTRRRQTSF